MRLTRLAHVRHTTPLRGGGLRGRAADPIRGAREDWVASAPSRSRPMATWSRSRSRRPTSRPTRRDRAIWMIPLPGGEGRRMTSGEKRDGIRSSRPTAERSRSSRTATAGPRCGCSTSRAAIRPARPRFRRRSPTTRGRADGRSFFISSDVFPECRDTACLETTLKAPRKREGPWSRSPNGSSSATGTPGRTARGRTSGRSRSSGAGAAVDLTPGDHDAPPFHIGGGVDWDSSPDGRGPRLLPPIPDKDEALSTNSDLFARARRRGRRARNLTAANPAFDGVAPFLARREVDRLPRADTAGLRVGPLPPHAPRPRRGASAA